MSEDKKREKETGKSNRLCRCRRLVLAAVALAIVFGILWKSGLLDSRSIDERLAAIDAELAIPDAENAAVFYRRFFTDPNNATILDDLHGYTPSAYREPWTDIEYPELAARLEKNQAFVQELIGISQMEEARFPVYAGPGTVWWQMLSDMRRVFFILSWAAAKELAEGRTDAAFAKYRCQMQLARHLGRQPATLHELVGIAIEAVALGNVRMVVMQDGVMPGQLRSLEEILEIDRGRDEVDAEIAAKVNSLIRHKELSQMSMIERLRDLLFGGKARREEQRRRRLIRLRLEATRRATPILIALRRYKEENGEWPDTLEAIERKLSAEMLIDPQNNGAFSYKRDGDSFIFYSKGPNGVDERGSYKRPADDWPIWPRKIE